MDRGTLTELLSLALKREPSAFTSVDDFWMAHVARHSELSLPVDRAFAGGAMADRLGYAFAAGYAAALHALLPELGPRALASLAATEEQGAHPKFIRTTLSPDGDGFRLNGKKSFVTLAGQEALVLVRAGETEDGRADLRLVRLALSREGVRREPLPAPPFVPEIGHAELYFDNVRVEQKELLPGDGWTKWVKPFRTVEDIHVHAAALGYLSSAALRFRWPDEFVERMLGVIAALRTLATEDPSEPAVHLALSGCIALTRAIVAQLDEHWAQAPAEERERWTRDSPLLRVAEKAREARRQKAWESVR